MQITGKNVTLEVNPKELKYDFVLSNGDVWKMTRRPYIEMNDGKMLYFDEAECSAREKKTATDKRVEAEYLFENGMKAYTCVSVENTRDDILFSFRIENDEHLSICHVAFPEAIDFNAGAGEGYTVIPRMQGTLIPSGREIPFHYGIVYERDAYMPMYGQVCGKSGYLAVFDTPYDARYSCQGQTVTPLFVPSLGKMSYKRSMLYRFMENCDYNDIAKSYRSYIKEKGMLVTLKEKLVRNPAVKRLIGAPIVMSEIAVHIHEKSAYYNKEDISQNDRYSTFVSVAEKLEALKKNGLERAYLHLDGWGKHGYDNLHPMAFPPHEAAGGAEGMKELSERCRKLGYIFGIHDQYRDYYYDSDGFTLDNAIENGDGSHPYCDVWYGGPHSWLCAKLAPKYVKQTYDEFENSGIVIEGAYLDVFSVVFMDECFNREHPMTREECRNARNECFNELTYKGIIPSSEETLGCFMDTQILCHHAPFFTDNLGSANANSVGVPIPLFNLVFHDCVVIPWFGSKKSRGGWGIPGTDCGYLYAILYGNAVYCDMNAKGERLEEVKQACKLYERLATEELVKHEFIDGNYRLQRTTFSDGTVIEANLDTGEYTVK